MKYKSMILGVVLAVQPVLILAQTEKVFRGGDMSESALVDALTPEGAAEQPVGGRTRQIRISPVGQTPAVKAKPPAASMLITFETNSAELTPKARQMLDVLGRALQSDKLAEFKFAIEGHADPRGGDQFNYQLSQLRAASVVKYLSEVQNISPGRLTPVGKGTTELMNTRDLAAPENRRVTVKTVVN